MPYDPDGRDEMWHYVMNYYFRTFLAWTRWDWLEGGRVGWQTMPCDRVFSAGPEGRAVSLDPEREMGEMGARVVLIPASCCCCVDHR